MKKYTRVYMDYFGYALDDFIPCEVCSSRANDIHHVYSRKKRPDLINDTDNLMALCRSCHIKYGDNKKYYDFLKEKHEAFKMLNIC